MMEKFKNILASISCNKKKSTQHTTGTEIETSINDKNNSDKA